MDPDLKDPLILPDPKFTSIEQNPDLNLLYSMYFNIFKTKNKTAKLNKNFQTFLWTV